MRDKSAIAQMLEPLESFDPGVTPSQIRQAVLRLVREVGEGDCAVFLSAVRPAGGGIELFAIETLDETPGRLASFITDDPKLLDPSLDLERPSRGDLEGFRGVGQGVALEAFEKTEVYKKVYVEGGLVDRARVLIYQGSELVGWLGALRMKGSPKFSRRQRERLGRLLPVLRRALIAAHTIEQQSLNRGTAYLVLGADGTVLNASESATGWLAHPGIKADLSAAVASLEKGQPFNRTRLLRVAQAEVVKLTDGATPARYLAVLKLSPPVVRAPDASLSAAQRAVAEQAARGNTVDEIASLVGRTPQTVRSYLREAYRRLGVSNRVELARALGVQAEA